MNSDIRVVLTRKWHILVFIISISIMLSLSAYYYFSYEANSIRREIHDELKTIASLKISQIENWNKERLAHAKFISQNPFIADCVKNIAAANANTSYKTELIKNLEFNNINSFYSNIIFSDNSGRLLLSLNNKYKQIDSTTIRFIKSAVKDKKIIFSDLHTCPPDDEIYLDYIAPILTKDNIVTGAVIFRINPYTYLYPAIKKWPTPSRTSETLIVKKENGNVLYLNQLNNQPNTALKFSIPLSRTEVPAVQGALGYQGIFEGISYHGTTVLSYISPVNGTPWIMVAQIDNNEIYAELYFKEIVAIVFTLLLILALSAGLIWFYHYRQRNIFRELFVKERQLSEYHEEFRTILYSIADGVIIIDTIGCIKQMNQTAEKLTGWTEEEACGKPIEDVFQIINEETHAAVENPVHKVLSIGIVAGLANHTLLISKNGDEIPIANSGSPIRNKNGEIEGVILVFRDKIEEHKAEQLIRQSEARLKRAELSSKSGNWELHLNSKIMFSSVGAEKIYGFSKSPFDYEETKKIPLPEYRPLLDKAIKNLIEKNEPYDIEFKIKAADTGEIKDIHSIAEYDKERNILFGVIQDITLRKRTEYILRESEERFRRTFEFAAIGNSLTSIDGKFVSVNDALCKMLGYSKDELISINFITITHPDDVEISIEYLKKLLSGEVDTCSFEKRYIKKDGSIIWVSANTTLLKDVKENPVHFIAHFIDITDRKHAEEKLVASEVRYRRLFETAKDGILILDAYSGLIVDVNQFLIELLGTTGDKILGKKFWELSYFNEIAANIEQFLELNQTEYTHYENIALKPEPGRQVNVEFNFNVYKVNHQKVIQCNIRDITERKKTEELLQQSEKKYRNLFNNIQVGMFRTKLDGSEVLDFNDYYLRIFRYTREEMVGSPSIMYWVDPLEREEMTNRLTAYGRVKDFECRFFTKNGNIIYCLTTVRAYPEEGILEGSIIDITERKQAEYALRQSEERFRNIFEEHTAVKLLIDYVTGNIADANKAAVKYYGWTKDELLQKNINDLNVLSSDQVKEGMEKTSSQEKKYYQFRHRLKNGTIRYVDVLSSGVNIGGKEYLHSIIIDITDRKLMEQVVQRNWQILQLFVEHAPASIAMFDTKMTYLAVSRRFLKDYDLGEQDIVGKIHYEVFPEIPDRWKEIHHRCLSGARESCEEDQFPRANGNLDWIRWEIIPWYEQQGEIGGILLFSEVITERKRTQEALRKSELGYHQLVDNAPIPVAVISLATGKFLYVNNDAYELINPFLNGKNVYDFIVADFYAKTKQRDEFLETLEKEGRISNMEIELKTPDGRQVVALTSSLITTFGNEPAVFTSFYDITDRKRAEVLLAMSEVRYRRLFESAKDGIIILDFETGIIMDVNPFLAELIGYSHERFIGKAIWEIGFFKDIAANRDNFLELQKKEYIRYEDMPLETFSGKQINVEFVSNVYTVNHNKVIQCNVRDITERKRMEAEARETEERFRLVFESVSDGINIYQEDIDPNKRVLIDCNKRYAEMAGRSREELLKHGNTLEFQKTLDDSANPNRLKALVTGISFQGSFAWIRPDGKENVIEYSSRPITWRGKKYSIGVDRDITERSKLLESQHKLSTAVNQSQIAIVITDKKGNIEYVNPKFTEITGYTFEEVVLHNPGILKSGEHSKEFYKNLWDTILSGNDWSGVMHNKKKNGELFWEFTKISPVKNDSGEITSFVAVKEDITTQVKYEEELKRYREHLEELVAEKTEQLTKQNIFFRTLLDTIPNPIYVENTELRFTEINKAYEELFETTREDALGKTNFDVAPFESANLAKQYDEQLLRNHETVVYESFMLNKRKGIVPLMIYKSSFGLPGKNPEGITALMIDISKQKEMERTTLEALKKEKELNEMKTNFISIASHEFRTPLTTIMSSTDLLEVHHNTWEESKTFAHFKKIQDSVQYIIAMLDEVLAISRSDKGKIDFKPAVINLYEFASEIIEQAKMQALPNHNIIYDYKLSYQNVNADPKLLTHILNNLLTNAVKFSPSGGDIVLSIEDDNDFIKFTITDNGIGIPVEDLNKLFEPFFRAKNSSGIKGTGLGLSIVKRYVELHNGEISLESKPGKGTQFFVKINKENNNI